MGDKVLNKLLTFILFIFMTLSLFADIQSNSKAPQMSIQRYNMIFDQISKKRIGPSDKTLSSVPTPFVNQNILKIIKDKNATKRKPIILRLHGIINKTVRINNKWYKLNSKVYGFRLVKIKNLSVILKRKRKKIELFLRKKNDKIKFTNNF